MTTVPEEIKKKQHRAEAQSKGLNAAIAIAEMDPHSREDLRCYLKALTEAQQAGEEDEIEYLIDAIAEVFGSASDGGAPDLETWSDEALQTPAGRDAVREVAADAEAFLARYQRLKAAAGMTTLQQVADAAGLSPTTVQAFETQRVKPHAGTLQKLAKAFRVEVSELVAG